MKVNTIADSIGVVLLATVAALPLSCVPTVDARQENLQPFVAVAGRYSLMVSGRQPAPPEPSTGCVEGCKCNGTGKEKSGDGLEVVPCRCPDSCSCKQRPKATAEATGWPIRNMER